MLSEGDDYPIHQRPEPIAFAGTDRNFYDRYFFNGYAETPGDRAFFAIAFGVYPHLNIADAAFVVVRDGVEIALHASRCLDMERMNLSGGPIVIEVVEPLQQLRVRVNAPDQGIMADLTFTGRCAPIEEPRFTRCIGPRTFMDYTRLTQNGRYQGWIELDGARRSVDGFVGTRDRSWGIRPIGARDPQAPAPAVAPQFFWLWSPTNFRDGSLFFHSNDDAAGLPWNRRAVWQPDSGALREVQDVRFEIRWTSGTRHAASAVITLAEGDWRREFTFTPLYNFFMLGLGYGHPRWAHGLCEVNWRDERGVTQRGRGVLEQLVLGPHQTSGFASALDFAP